MQRVIHKEVIKHLFDGWEESLIYSCLQGHMGEAYANATQTSAFIIVDVFCFLAGEPSEDLVTYCYEHIQGFHILTCRNEQWHPLIERVYPQYQKSLRYALKREPNVFDMTHLSDCVNQLPASYTLRQIDGQIYQRVLEQEWSKDLCAVFKSQEEYQAHGLGVVAIYEGEIVAGASSYIYYEEGIEVEIDTRIDHRRRGLALACGAKLILESSKQGRYASWDAQNTKSLALAEKLGYHFNGTYEIYEVFGKAVNTDMKENL